MTKLTIQYSVLQQFKPFLLGYCNCGCGKNVNSHGLKLKKYRKGHYSRINNPYWKGGMYISSDGYRLILKPTHHNHDYHGYVREHRLVMEQHLGRYLNKDEEIHHINGNKLDNRIENLQLTSKSNHTQIHMSCPRVDMSDRRCAVCGSNKTYINEKGHQYWSKNDDGFLCNQCRCKLRYKMSKR